MSKKSKLSPVRAVLRGVCWVAICPTCKNDLEATPFDLIVLCKKCNQLYQTVYPDSPIVELLSFEKQLLCNTIMILQEQKNNQQEEKTKI
ncbi:MAG: hypothetical protein ACFFBD_25185 [Candidatus Hodarchaeota archaeon]